MYGDSIGDKQVYKKFTCWCVNQVCEWSQEKIFQSAGNKISAFRV